MSEIDNGALCPDCGKALAADDRFCSGCGSRLSDRESSAATGSGTRTSLSQLFAHLRSGEQRPATILMADVAGFSALGESADPEWVFNLIDGILRELGDCVVAHGGHIDKYVGDEVMALFGVPFAQERSAERAVRAALAMRERLRVLSEAGRFGETAIRLHVGINQGPVMVGPLGHHSREDYTVIGDAVNVTKRVEDAAPPGEIYLTEAVRQAVGDVFELAEVGRLPLAGRQQQELVFRVIGARHAELTEARWESEDAPLTGREAELTELIAVSQRVAAGDYACACVAGPPGIGKSCLLGEWQRQAGKGEFHTIAVECHAFGDHFPLLPVVELVSRLAGLPLSGWPPAPLGPLPEAVGRLPLDETDRRPLVELLQGAGPPNEDPAGEWRDRLCQSLSSALRNLAQERPLCLLLEDAQWIDEASRALLTDVLSAAELGSTLVLLAAREPGEAWPEQLLQAQVIRLEPLPGQAMVQLVAQWAAPTVLPDDTIRAICGRAQGHPYFARELTLGLRGASTSPLADASLPATLKELFLSQLDGLAPGLRHLVQCASVVGEPLSASLLQAAMGDEGHRAFSTLSRAVSKGLVQVGATPGQFVFGRRLLFEAAYSTIPNTQRRSLHARIANHLLGERSRLGETALHAAAHHAYHGFGDERAVDLLIESAEQYRLKYANRRAIRDASRAAELITALPDPEALLSQRLRALLFLSQSYQIVGELDRAQGAVDEAEVLAEDCPEADLRARLALTAATVRQMKGEIDEAAMAFEQAREAWEMLGNAERVAHSLLGMGMCAQQSGDRARALALFQEAARRGADTPWAQAAALNNAGIVLLEEGRYAEAEPFLRDGLRANQEADDPRGVAHSKTSVGELCYRLARFDEARKWLDEALQEAREMEDARCVQDATVALARVLALCGEPEFAAATLAKASVAAGAQDCESRALLATAKLETRAAVGGDIVEEAAAQLMESADEGETNDLRSAIALNAAAEALCLAVEEALKRGDTHHLPRLADALRQALPQVPDRHLTRYADWLIGLATDRKTVHPLPMGITSEHTVFAVRADRLQESLGI